MACQSGMSRDATVSQRAGPGGLARGQPSLDLGDEPADPRVLRPVAGSGRVDRGDREAEGGAMVEVLQQDFAGILGI